MVSRLSRAASRQAPCIIQVEPDLMVVRFSDVDISYDIKRQVEPSGRTGS